MEQVVLVDDKDEVLGTMEKLEAHEKGMLHRAFSVMVFNSKGELMLQKRAAHKYHSGGLWSNTCCSHPRPNDHVFTAVFDGAPELNTDEAEDWRFVPISKLRQDIAENPSNYTEWFKIIMDKYAQI